MTAPTVAARALTLRYARTLALDDVSLNMHDGVTGLLGPNGAGKTTLLRIVATAMTPDKGELTVLGHDPHSPAGRLAVRRRLGYLPQSPGFHPSFTAFAFVDYVAILKEQTNRGQRHEEVRRVLSVVGLDAHRGKKIKALSGGMRQRVALAAALVGDPDLLVLDEPTVGLDPEQRLRFRELIAELGERRTVLLSTHQTEDVMTLCRKVVVLDRGRILFEGTPTDLADLARGRVWTSPAREPGALAAWRTGTGSYRNVGHPPGGAQLIDPTLEDGYLMLIERPGSADEVSP
ncbi:ABC transporter ATP-binding protein [Catenulispora rubra]|uniref:ABC transporter ATP-binding protein n=1 Tax=Catenulispora rubra TaxID=280293 RepID=UPI0018921B6A|nr:ABC transporter ATP-binding protein [Catenulispora rubra]